MVIDSGPAELRGAEAGLLYREENPAFRSEHPPDLI